MDALVSTLPIQNQAKLYIINPSSAQEGNICTKDQVNIARKRGWRVYKSTGGYYDGSESEDHIIIKINEENFPDENFRAFLKEQWYGQDTILTEKTIKLITTINVSSRYIKSLKGIELFTALEYLYCSSNQLTSLDVSKNTALEYLDCSYNQLTSLDVSNNTTLTRLDCYVNQLTSLDVSKNTALKMLECSFNQLTSLDMSKNTALEELSCLENQLTTLDVSGCTALTALFCPRNQLTSLDLSKNTTLMGLECGGNQLTSLDVSENIALESLKCSGNQLPSLDVSKNIALTELKCDNNQLTSLDVSKNTALEILYCYENQLTSLDVSGNTTLRSLECNSNQLTSLNVSNNKALTRVHCYDNKIKGEAMDAFVGSLPIQSWAKIFFVDLSNSSEENTCTTLQVNTAKERGWSVWAYTGNGGWSLYEGSDPSGIQVVTLDKKANASVHNLNGRRLKELRKGINIVGGKKILKQ